MTKDFDIYKNFPTDVSYKIFLYNLKLKNSLICPYCYSDKISTYNDLFHCNICNSKFSITTNTIMHKTKLDYRKWLLAINLFIFDENISYRKLSKNIVVNKNTAYKMIKKLNYLYTYFKIDI
ncbi:IS1 family transposase, partial [Clostridioides difficile]|nr:IS1 family transposase [Clostridioides difficile]